MLCKIGFGKDFWVYFGIKGNVNMIEMYRFFMRKYIYFFYWLILMLIMIGEVLLLYINVEFIIVIIDYLIGKFGIIC